MEIRFLNKKRIAAIENGKTVGYLRFYHPKERDTVGSKRNIVIDYMFVKPECRRKGIATKMLQFFLRHFKKVVWVTLWTGKQSENDKSYVLYKKLGFKKLAYQSDYYQKGMGTHLFAKKNSNSR